jgi:hypothetical protein
VKREETRTGLGDNVDDTVAVVPDTDRRGPRLCGSRRRDTGEGVEKDGEFCVVLRELDAPELFPEAEDEDRVGILPWKRRWRCTGGWRANKSLIIVLSASLNRTPFGRICFLGAISSSCGNEISRGGCSSILVTTYSSDSARCLSLRAYGKSCRDVISGPLPLSWSSMCSDPPERERISRLSTSSCSPSLVTTSFSSHCSGRSRRSKFGAPGPPVRSVMASSVRAWAKRVTACTHKR